MTIASPVPITEEGGLRNIRGSVGIGFPNSAACAA
jgi:hypothetical protein